MSTTATCPNGHESEAPDYCDTCGAPIAEGGGSAGASAATPATSGGETASEPVAGPESCLSCGADKASGALFCEACGYDFTTGTMPRPAEASPCSSSMPSPTDWKGATCCDACIASGPSRTSSTCTN